jgi:hypothetical protein
MLLFFAVLVAVVATKIGKQRDLEVTEKMTKLLLRRFPSGGTHRRCFSRPKSAEGATSHLLSCNSQDLSSSSVGGLSACSTARIAASTPSGFIPGVEKVAVAARSTMVSAEKDLIAFPQFVRGLF